MNSEISAVVRYLSTEWTTVREHMKYKQYPYGLETAWKNGVGNCMTYAELTSTMLYYAGLPNGYAFENGHIINIVLCDGRWVCIDSQGMFDYDPNKYEDITVIAIMSNDMVFVIDDATGIKLDQVGYDSNKVDNALKKRGVTIPSWIKGYYTEGWSDMYKGMVIRGTKGSVAEKMVRELGYNSISYKGNSFIAKMTAIKTPAKPKVKIKGMKGKIKVRYTKAKNATGFQVSYKRAGAKKYKSKQFNCRKSAVRTIKKLRPGKYSVRVRSIRKADGKTTYSKWTKVKKVRVK